MNGLTTLQRTCLRLIGGYIAREGRAPTRRELTKLTGQKSTHGVNQILNALRKKGYLSISPGNRPRNIRVLRVSANQPAPAAERVSAQEKHHVR